MIANDDIDHNNRNPFPGQIFNHPDGKNVYANIAIDYYGKDVTPENFIAVLTGDKDAVKKMDERTTGKVLTSTKDDKVYIYFSEHGSDNLIAFPSKYLYADELIDTFNIMYQKKLYKNLVFYLDASKLAQCLLIYLIILIFMPLVQMGMKVLLLNIAVLKQLLMAH